ncbi:hypothetical protein SASPL_106816 [Salvia splendens]|uniref:Receptor ligand binding region domain-containing protein n=1 Tax=Salvia splendens TaxID=180675 RepID=A0A8X8YBW1_SALSN|nr:hypothetical protein SASPL_106816 [Salvia splendens]
MAIEDFYSKNTYKTMIVPHFRDSNIDIVSAASAAIDLLKNTQVIEIFGPQASIQADFVIDIAKAVASIVNHFGWREVVLVYQDTNDGSGLLPFLAEDLLESNALVSNMIPISPSANNDAILERLFELKKMQTRVFVVHMLPPVASRDDGGGCYRSSGINPWSAYAQMHLRGSRIRNSTDLEAIGISNSGPQLAHLLRNFTSKGLSGDFVIKNGELQASVFEIMHVVGNGANSVGFWRKNHGISKRLNKGDGDDDPKQRLGAVVWPGQTSEAPLGWEVAAANTRMLKIGVPTKCRASQLVDVSIDEEAGKVNASGFCIDVFEEAMRSLPYPVQLEYIPFKNADQNSTVYNYDSLIQQLALKLYIIFSLC